MQPEERIVEADGLADAVIGQDYKRPAEWRVQ
jgi:hypothetical protein